MEDIVGVDLDDLEATEETEETEEDEYVPPTKEELAKLQKEYKRANDQAAKYRLQLKQAEDSKKNESTDVESAKKAAAQEVESKYKTRIINAEAKSELVKMGLLGSPDRLLKTLDLDVIDVDDDGVIGLSPQLEAIKSEYPELFGTKKVVADPRTKKDAANKEAQKQEVDWTVGLANYMRNGKA